MAGRKDFVSDGLLTLRNKHSQNPPTGSESKSNKQTTPQTTENNIVSNNRREQSSSKKQEDLFSRLHRQHSILQEDLRNRKQDIEDAEALCKNYEQLLAELEKQNFSDPANEKKLEEIRIKLLRSNAVFDKLYKHYHSGTGMSSQISLLPELNSMNLLQLARTGFFATLPLIAGVVTGSIIIALAIMICMGGFG